MGDQERPERDIGPLLFRDDDFGRAAALHRLRKRQALHMGDEGATMRLDASSLERTDEHQLTEALLWIPRRILDDRGAVVRLMDVVAGERELTHLADVEPLVGRALDRT